MEREIKIMSGSIFGYDTIVMVGDEIVALKGDGVPELHKGMTVKLIGDSRGYIQGGFKPGEEVVIVGFCEPFKHGSTDYIIEVKNTINTGWIKPSNLLYEPVARDRAKWDGRHWKMSHEQEPFMREFMDAVYQAMPEQTKRDLPTDRTGYYYAMINYALNNLDDFGDLLIKTVATHYDGNRGFILDMERSGNATGAALYLDADRNLVSVYNPQKKHPAIENNPVTKISNYDYYIVLMGPLKGKKFFKHNRPLDQRDKKAVTTRVEKTLPPNPIPDSSFPTNLKGEDTLVDTILRKLKNHKLIAYTVVAAIILIGVAEVLGAFEKLWLTKPSEKYAMPDEKLMTLYVDRISAVDMAASNDVKNLSIQVKVISQSPDKLVPRKSKGEVYMINDKNDTVRYEFDVNGGENESGALPPGISFIVFDGLVSMEDYKRFRNESWQLRCVLLYDTDVHPIAMKFTTPLFPLNKNTIEDGFGE